MAGVVGLSDFRIEQLEGNIDESANYGYFGGGIDVEAYDDIFIFSVRDKTLDILIHRAFLVDFQFEIHSLDIYLSMFQNTMTHIYFFHDNMNLENSKHLFLFQCYNLIIHL